MKFGFFCAIFLSSCILLQGCSPSAENYIIPTSYSGQGIMKVFTENNSNEYEIDVNRGQESLYLSVSCNDISWNMAYDGNQYVLNNNKFEESSVNIASFKLIDSLANDFDMSKFAVEQEKPKQEMTFKDGVFTHVLTFNKKSCLPEKISVYKNDFLVKTIEYNNIKIE